MQGRGMTQTSDWYFLEQQFWQPRLLGTESWEGTLTSQICLKPDETRISMSHPDDIDSCTELGPKSEVTTTDQSGNETADDGEKEQLSGIRIGDKQKL